MPDPDTANPTPPVANRAAPAPDEVPEAQVVAREGPSLVWLIPLIALLIGGWLAYKSYAERGPTIQIRFTTAAGLVAGKTEVRFKDVAMGKVSTIDVTEDLSHVVVTAALTAGTERYLTAKTRFWVARPQITATRVSGLDTLLSGAYIAMDPVIDGEPERDFVGLAEEPLVTTSQRGRRFTLRAPTLGSLNAGSPVYYRDIPVGQVIGYDLDDGGGGGVDVRVFVMAPHETLVNTNTRFWNVSGIDFSLSADGFKLDTQSMLSVLIGGVAFDTPDTLEADGQTAPPDHLFPLYPSREEAHERTYLKRKRYLLYFDGSVRGLSVGAPVELRGIRIGRVLDIQLQIDVAKTQFQIPVLVEVEPERIGIVGDATNLDPDHAVDRLVERGLRAQLTSGNLLTGQLYVNLDLYPDAQPQTVGRGGEYEILPTVPATLAGLTAKVNAILDKLERLPLDRLGEDLEATVARVRALAEAPEVIGSLRALEETLKTIGGTVTGIDRDVVPRLTATLEQASSTLKSAQGLVAPNSATAVDLRGLLQEMSAAARSVRGLTDYLERHPEALLKGKGGTR
jgi:paraquat-inducible protein B